MEFLLSKHDIEIREYFKNLIFVYKNLHFY